VLLYQRNLISWQQKSVFSWIYTWKVHIKYLYNFKTSSFEGNYQVSTKLDVRINSELCFQMKLRKFAIQYRRCNYNCSCNNIWCRDNKNLHIVVKIIIEICLFYNLVMNQGLSVVATSHQGSLRSHIGWEMTWINVYKWGQSLPSKMILLGCICWSIILNSCICLWSILS